MLASTLLHLSDKPLVLVLFLQPSGSSHLLLCSKLPPEHWSLKQPGHFPTLCTLEIWGGPAGSFLFAPRGQWGSGSWMVLSKVFSSLTALVPQGSLASSSFYMGSRLQGLLTRPGLLRAWRSQGSQTSDMAARGTKGNHFKIQKWELLVVEGLRSKTSPASFLPYSISSRSPRANPDLEKGHRPSYTTSSPSLYKESQMCSGARQPVILWSTMFFVQVQVPCVEGLLRHVQPREMACHRPC